MAFDVDGALQAGYSLDDIGEHVGFDVNAARKSGYSDDDIKQYLASVERPKTDSSPAPANVVQQTDSSPAPANVVQQTQPAIKLDLGTDDNVMMVQEPQGQFQQSLDTQTTMTEPQMEISQQNAPKQDFTSDVVYSAQQEARGAMADFAGIYKTGLDILGTIPGIKDTSLYQQWQQDAKDAITYWNDSIKKAAKKTGYDEGGFLSPSNLGRMLPMFLVPMGESRGAAVVLNGALAYAETSGEGKETREALVDSALAMGLTYGSLKIFDYLAKPNAEKVLDTLKDKLKVTDDQVNSIVKDYLTVMKGEEPETTLGKITTSDRYNDAATKTKALLWYAGKNKLNIGAKLITQVAKESIKAEKEIEHAILKRKELLKDLVRNKYDNIETFAKDMQKVELQIKEDYAKFKERIGKTSVESRATKLADDLPLSGPEWEALSENLRSELLKIKQLGSKEQITIDDLMEAHKAVNKLLSSNTAKGTSKGFNLQQIKNVIDSELRRHMSKEDYKVWKEINKDYSKMLTYKQSKLGQLVDSVIGNNPKTGTYSANTVLDKLPNLVESVDTFKAVRELLGTEKAVKLENFIIDEVLNKVDDFNWGRLKSMLGKKGFVSDNGKQLQRLADLFEKNFKVDNLYTKTLKDLELKEGAKTNVSDMFKALGVKQIGNLVLKLSPTERGAEARFVGRLTKILENPSNVRKIEEAIEGMSLEGRKRIIDDVVKQLEYRPDVTTRIADNVVNYVTPGGKAIQQGIKGTETKVSKAVLAEKQDKLIRDFVTKTLGNKVDDTTVERAMEHFNNYKIDDILKQAKEQLSDVEFKKWSSVYNNIVKGKVKDLVNRIESDIGIKMPESEVENLFKREWKKDIIMNSPRYKDLPKFLNRVVEKDKLKALDNVKNQLVKESKQLAKKLKVSEEEAFKILLNKMRKDCE